MRRLNLSPKKMRGLKRKCKKVADLPNLFKNFFPSEDRDRGYWHFHMPFEQNLLDGPNSKHSIRHLLIQNIVTSVEVLIESKPKSKDRIRVVSAIDLPELWSSQIIVFFGDQYYSTFFERNSEDQKWIPLPTERSLTLEWGINRPKEFIEKGYKEVIQDEDYSHEGEIWFIGEE